MNESEKIRETSNAGQGNTNLSIMTEFVSAGEIRDYCSDLRVNRQRMNFVLFLGLCSSVKCPGNFRNRSPSDVYRNLDGCSCSTVHQIWSTHVQSDSWLNCKNRKQSIKKKKKVLDTAR